MYYLHKQLIFSNTLIVNLFPVAGFVPMTTLKFSSKMEKNMIPYYMYSYNLVNFLEQIVEIEMVFETNN